jgi:hypothetical protein
MLFKDICQQHSVKNIELAMGGYGKGYIEATRIFSTVKDSLEVLRDKRNMNIVLLAHSQITNFTEPATQFAYQRYEVKMQKGSSALFREYVDTVLFFNLELFTKTEGQNTRTFSDGARIMYTERRPGWDAKNRFGLPLKLDLSWDSLIQSIEKAKPMSLEAVTEKIDGLMSFIHDEELKTKVIDTVIAAKGDVLRLQAIANRLEIRVSES